MSRDVVFVKYNTSDKLKNKYISIRVLDIKMSRDVAALNTTRQMRKNITIVQFQYQIYRNV